MTRRGFTLLELALAVVAAAMVLVVASGMMFSADRMQRTGEASFARTAEMGALQTVCRRAFLSVVLRSGSGTTSPELVAEMQAEQERAASGEGVAAADPADASVDPASSGAGDDSSDGPPARPQIVLEADPAAGAGFIQRLELEMSASPVPPGMATRAASWAAEQDDYASLNFLTADGSSGRVRGVFELRRDGTRERVLRELGLGEPVGIAASAPAGIDDAGYTLWFRRMPADEVDLLRAGRLPWPDGSGDRELERRRLAGAVPLARGLSVATWTIFKLNERLRVYRASHVNELPAYAELELRSTTGFYSSWLFEVDWTVESAAQRAARLAGDAGSDAETGGGGAGGGQDGGQGGGAGGGGGGSDAGSGGSGGADSGSGSGGSRPGFSRPRRLGPRGGAGGGGGA